MENWKDIPGYEGKYQVSNCGRIKSLRSGRLLKLQKTKKGYLQVILHKDSKAESFRVHRLVAIVFIPNPNNCPMVNHKDENKQNNIAENLEWCDNSYNCRYGTGIKRQIESKLKTGSIKYPELAGLAIKDHKEYCRKWKEITGYNHPRTNLKVVGTKDGVDYEFEDTYIAAETIHSENKKTAGKNIEAAINGRRRSAYGYTWRYA